MSAFRLVALTAINRSLTGMLRWLRILVVALVWFAALQAAESPMVIPGDGLTLPSGITSVSIRCDAGSGPLRPGPGGSQLDGDCIAGKPGKSGLEVTAIARSLRGMNLDDWREGLPIAGKRSDTRIALLTQAWGSRDEHRAWNIGGSPKDWDAISLQWDGWLRVMRDGTSIATASDDGSRLWLDRNGDGVVDPDEWGSNGWGAGQGETLRVVHSDLRAGIYRMRTQVEEGGGGNVMSVLWDDHEHSAGLRHGWHIIPDEAYVQMPMLRLGAGSERLFVRGALRIDPITITGHVELAAAAQVSGVITVESGATLVLNDGLCAGATLNIAEGGRVVLRGQQRCLGLIGHGEVVGEAATLELELDRDASLAGSISGDITLTKKGPGHLAINQHEWPGALTIHDGSVIFAKERVLLATTLRGPLVTVIPLPLTIAGPRDFRLNFRPQQPIPTDLGLGVYAGDRHGTWFQRGMHASMPLTGGTISFDFGNRPVMAGSGIERWSTTTEQRCDRSGCFLWTAAANDARIVIDARVTPRVPASAPIPHRLLDAQWPAAVATGERWALTCRPEPWPINPEASDDFTLDAVVVGPDEREQRLLGFWEQPMRRSDRGDVEIVDPDGEAHFSLRYRPLKPGNYTVKIQARWKSGHTAESQIHFFAQGQTQRPYVRIDSSDSHYFALGDDVFWPIGLNIRSVNDPRCESVLATNLTPDRRALSYEAYFARCSAAGINAIEVWLAAWNVGLEWRADWFGYDGIGRYNQQNAWRLDRVLDAAWQHGIRLNLVIRNHGQGSDSTDHEWENNPWNADLGGPCATAADFFSHPQALAGQEAYRRYIIARYADHPAILGWKLWSEVNLTRAGDEVVAWHERDAARWHALDPYAHPVTTHWAGNYRSVNREVAALPGLDYLCIDAYHSGDIIARLIAAGTTAPDALTGKPVLVTEFGGSPGAGPEPQIDAELASAPFAAWVSGGAGSPMLWWYEWVDQKERWGPYRAIAAFIAGEDPRGGSSVELRVLGDGGAWLGRAWVVKNRVTGYVIDPLWGRSGQVAMSQRQATVLIPTELAAGAYELNWWNADLGTVIQRERIDHLGGRMTLPLVDASRHRAFKLIPVTP